MTRRVLRNFATDDGGVAAIEFAMILPVLVTLYFGTVELTRAIETSRRLSLFARTMADLAGRADNPNPTTSDMATIAGAATAILRPLNTSGLQIVVSAMGVENISGSLYGGVCSSWQQNATVRTRLTVNGTNGLPATPASYQFDGARYILAEVTLPYTPIIGANLYQRIFGSRGLVFTRQIPWAERTTSEIIMPGGSACPTYP
nr:TadE/TadG family type IV pilus assembly protein [Methylobacterium sp. WL103]